MIRLFGYNECQAAYKMYADPELAKLTFEVLEKIRGHIEKFVDVKGPEAILRWQEMEKFFQEMPPQIQNIPQRIIAGQLLKRLSSNKNLQKAHLGFNCKTFPVCISYYLDMSTLSSVDFANFDLQNLRNLRKIEICNISFILPFFLTISRFLAENSIKRDRQKFRDFER